MSNKLMADTLQGVTCLLTDYMIKQRPGIYIEAVAYRSYNGGVVDRRQH